MARFCKKHTRASLLIAPISANVAVALMNIADTLAVMNRDYAANLVIVYQIFDFSEECGITQDMANKDFNALFLCGVRNVAALAVCRGNGLFEQQVVPLFNSLHSGSIVHIVACCYNGNIGKFVE